jgi:hypothetical protein
MGDGSKSFQKSVLVNTDELDGVYAEWLNVKGKYYQQFLDDESFFFIANASHATAYKNEDVDNLTAYGNSIFWIRPHPDDNDVGELDFQGLAKFLNAAPDVTDQDFLKRTGIVTPMFKLDETVETGSYSSPCITKGDSGSPGLDGDLALEVRGLINTGGTYSVSRNRFGVDVSITGDAPAVYIQRDADSPLPTFLSRWNIGIDDTDDFVYGNLDAYAIAYDGANITWGRNSFLLNSSDLTDSTGTSDYPVYGVHKGVTGSEANFWGIWDEHLLPGAKSAGGLVYENGTAPGTGDLWYGSGGVSALLGIGTTGQFLRVTAGLPAWESIDASDIPYTAVDADWVNADPTTLQQAVTRIAAELAILKGAAIT